jgi:hypothetical protein
MFFDKEDLTMKKEKVFCTIGYNRKLDRLEFHVSRDRHDVITHNALSKAVGNKAEKSFIMEWVHDRHIEALQYGLTWI